MELNLFIGGNSISATTFDTRRAQYAASVAQSVCQQIINAGFKNCVIEIEGQRYALGIPSPCGAQMPLIDEKGSEYKAADLYKVMEKLTRETKGFKYGEWEVEGISYDCSMRIRYGRDDIMTVRFVDKRDRQIQFRGEYINVSNVLIGGRNTHYRPDRNPTVVSGNIRLNQINWESLDPIGDEIFDCILALLKKYK